ncbi:hypothetical protein [Cucumibacter marinus]|uniref:hypothetical protein n=1 Tax=Cucumibacter marinus TaxID=1121252 RepID=UPI000414EF6B|nr:hypothetical protein [Cucumibacter marinus]
MFTPLLRPIALATALSIAAPAWAQTVPPPVQQSALEWYTDVRAAFEESRAKPFIDIDGFRDYLAGLTNLTAFRILTESEPFAPEGTTERLEQEERVFKRLTAILDAAYAVLDGTVDGQSQILPDEEGSVGALFCSAARVSHAIGVVEALETKLALVEAQVALGEWKLADNQRVLEDIETQLDYLDRGFTHFGARVLLGIDVSGSRPAMSLAEFDRAMEAFDAQIHAADTRAAYYRAAGGDDAVCTAYRFILYDPEAPTDPRLILDFIEKGRLIELVHLFLDTRTS